MNQALYHCFDVSDVGWERTDRQVGHNVERRQRGLRIQAAIQYYVSSCACF